jgi:Transposase DDE domain group 1
MTRKGRTPSTGKVRRDFAGGKRGQGNKRLRAIRRPNAAHIAVGKPDSGLTALAGLVGFGTFLRALGVDKDLQTLFGEMKSRRAAIYPMEAQLRLLMDLFVSGEPRVFGLESLAADPLFAHLAGGSVPSIDTVYRDLERFDETTIATLDEYMSQHGLAPVESGRFKVVHIDIDTTVEPLFGEHEGGLPGPNPHYHARPSYHPILARVAETDTIVGAQLRPGNTGFGGTETDFVERVMGRVRKAIGPDCIMHVRIDGAADCTEIMQAIDKSGAFYTTKAKMTSDLCSAVAYTSNWITIDRDAMNKPTKQVAVIDFTRHEWQQAALPVRVIAVRTHDRDSGKQIYLWNALDYTVQVFLTNDIYTAPEDIAQRYDLRAGIEPLIGELKSAWGIGKVPSQAFNANHAALLIKLLTHNLLRRFVAARAPALRRWRAPWIRRVLILVPGRLGRRARHRTLRMAPRPSFSLRE